MVAKIALFLTAIVSLATASPLTPDLLSSATKGNSGSTTTVSQCDTGSAKCCNSVQDSNSEGFTQALGLLGLALGPVTGLVGLQCTNIVGNSGCTQQPVCCEGNQFNGLVNVGCSPLAL